MADQKTTTSAKMLTLVRELDAPRELVFKAWTDPEHMKQWWGPKGFTCPVYELDLRVGGKFRGAMRSPEGQDFWSAGEYVEIDPPKKLVCTDYFSNEKGEKVDPVTYGFDESFPKEMLVTVTFEDLGENRTKMTIVQTMPEATAKKMGAFEGWNTQLDKLEEFLAAA